MADKKEVEEDENLNRKDVGVIIMCSIVGFFIAFSLNQGDVAVSIFSGLIGGAVGFVAGTCVVAGT